MQAWHLFAIFVAAITAVLDGAFPLLTSTMLAVAAVVLTGTISLSAGNQTYAWGGKGNNGLTWPDGNYTLSINATGANGQAVTVTTEVQAK